MLAALLLPVFHQGADIRTVELRDGGEVRVRSDGKEQSYLYWSCADTHLDAREPGRNFGGSHTLVGGPSRVVLLRFGDLNRAASGYRRVRKATLYLSPSGQGRPQLAAVRRVLVPWGEGPAVSPYAAAEEKRAPAWSATWRARRAGDEAIEWQQGGASGTADSEALSGVSLSAAGDEVAVTGLEAAVQTMLDRWHENHGFALAFAEPTELFSSDAPHRRPRLVLELERAPLPSGPDLSVTLIERRPEIERGAKPWREGEEVTYVAHVRNVGDAPAQGFRATWVVRERAGSGLEVRKALSPGEATTLEMKRPFRGVHSDHRVQPLGLRIAPLGPDAVAGNDYLEIQEAALPVAVDLLPEQASAVKAAGSALGSRSTEDGVQELIRVLNEAQLAESRFSFAPDGALERFRLREIGGGAAKSEAPQDRARVQARDGVVTGHDAPFPASVVRTVGVAGLGSSSLAPLSLSGEAQGWTLVHEGRPVSRGTHDRFAGLNGGGSTLRDFALPKAIPLPYEPVASSIYESLVLEPTGLFSATDVAVLNAGLGSFPSPEPRTFRALPETVMVKALTFDGRPVFGTELAFFQKGALGKGEPIFTVRTDASGSALLPRRAEGEGVFGMLDSLGTRAVFLVRAQMHGVSEWAWLRAWQLIDARNRTGLPVATVELRFNLPSQPVDTGSNLAANRVVTDSADSLPARLVKLVDGNLDSEVDLPNAEGAWVEIDLGRDRPVGEVRLATRSLELWRRFDVVTYITGQAASDATPWAREADWAWTSRNRRDVDPATKDVASVAYRSFARRARYVRLVCREPGAQARLAEIQVYGLQQAGGP